MIVWNPNKAVDIGELAISGGGRLERFCTINLLLFLFGHHSVLLFYAIAIICQLYLGSDMIYEMRRRMSEPTLWLTQLAFNLPTPYKHGMTGTGYHDDNTIVYFV